MNNNTCSTVENYREFFTKEYLMGPNSLRLLDEMLRKYPLKEGSRVMDLDCFDEAWNDWFISEHEYAIKDKAYFDRGMGEYLSFIGLVIRRK